MNLWIWPSGILHIKFQLNIFIFEALTGPRSLLLLLKQKQEFQTPQCIVQDRNNFVKVQFISKPANHDLFHMIQKSTCKISDHIFIFEALAGLQITLQSLKQKQEFKPSQCIFGRQPSFQRMKISISYISMSYPKLVNTPYTTA